MSFHFTYFDSTNAKINQKFEKLKYQTSPTIFKILYDKYNRPDIYNKIIDKQISLINQEKVLKIEIKNKFGKTSENNNLNSNTPYKFQENLIYSFYDTIFKERMMLMSLVLANVFQFGVYKLVKSLKIEQKTFIFLDNNRAIFNKLIKFNTGFLNFLKFNMGLTSLLFVYYFGNYLVKEYYRPSKEEMCLLDNYRRSIMLYSKILN
jgi:hypothetical protein